MMRIVGALAAGVVGGTISIAIITRIGFTRKIAFPSTYFPGAGN